MNQGFPDKARIEAYRKTYPAGTRVELVKMDDPYTKLCPGDRGRVFCIDDAGGIHINWDNGSSLAAIIGEDIIRKIEEDTQ